MRAAGSFVASFLTRAGDRSVASALRRESGSSPVAGGGGARQALSWRLYGKKSALLYLHPTATLYLTACGESIQRREGPLAEQGRENSNPLRTLHTGALTEDCEKVHGADYSVYTARRSEKFHVRDTHH